MPLSAIWEVVAVPGGGATKVDRKRLEDFLANGWEPYAATQMGTGSEFLLHLRRKKRA